MDVKTVWKAHGKRMGEYCYFPKTLFLFLFLLMFSGFLFAGWGDIIQLTSSQYSTDTYKTMTQRNYAWVVNDGDTLAVSFYKEYYSPDTLKIALRGNSTSILNKTSIGFNMESVPVIISNGNIIHIAFKTSYSGNLQFYYCNYNCLTSSWSSEECVYDYDEYMYIYAIRLDSFNNPIIFFLKSEDSEDNLYFTRKSSGTWQTPVKINTSSSANIGDSHAIVVGDSIFAVYQKVSTPPCDIYFRKGNLSGSFASEELIAEDATLITLPCIARSSDKAIHVIWVNEDCDLMYRQRTSSWALASPVLSDYVYGRASLYIDGDDYRHIAYSKNINDSLQTIYYVEYEGSPPTHTQISSDGTAYTAYAPEIVGATDGDIWVAWVQSTARNYSEEAGKYINTNFRLFCRKLSPSAFNPLLLNTKSLFSFFQDKDNLIFSINPKVKTGNINFYNLRGQMVKSIRLNGDTKKVIPKNLFSNGVYIAFLKYQNEKQSYKFALINN